MNDAVLSGLSRFQKVLLRFTIRSMKNEPLILYEDADMLAVSKPSGWLSVPDRYDQSAVVVVQELRMDFGRLWTVHRLDKDTSGVLLLARNAVSHEALSGLFESGAVRKVYEAVSHGRPSWGTTVCELPLMPDGDRQHRTIIDGAAKVSRTDFTLLGAHGSMSILEARPLTGRTHQIRVHLAALGLPVACDPLYGDGLPVYLSSLKRRWKGDSDFERPIIQRTALHARRITLRHPLSGAELTIEAPPPKDFKALCTQLRKL